MYRRRKLQTRYIVLMILSIVALFLAILFGVIRDEREYSVPEKLTKDFGFIISKVFSAPTNFIKGNIDAYNDKQDLYKKYKDLEKQKSEFYMQSELINEMEKEKKELAALLELETTLTTFDKEYTTVSGRDINSWLDSFDIDKGENEGVETGYAVISSEGLIGKVVATSYLTSKVKLITSADFNKTSVKIEAEDGYVFGLLSGFDKEKNHFIIEGINENKEIMVGASVTTSGVGSMFPSGLSVGKVKSITTDNFDLARIVYIESDVDFDDLNYMAVLKTGVSK